MTANAWTNPTSNFGLIGSSPQMADIQSLIRRVGRSKVSVLITGESGTGKELVANAISQCGQRAAKPFVAINCAAIPGELLESELFGHTKGAFTGASERRRGLFEEANEGTVFLDEIGDLSLPLQAKILRVLQTKQIKALGQNVTKQIDVRIISATHKSLRSLIQSGDFREDLYYRLNVISIHLPVLRDRREDIVCLAEYFLNLATEHSGQSKMMFAKDALAKLLSMQWRGNVRELENTIERAVIMSDGLEITAAEILIEDFESSPLEKTDPFNSGLTLKEIERKYIEHVLSQVGNRKGAATRVLGIDRKTLYQKEKLYGTVPAAQSASPEPVLPAQSGPLLKFRPMPISIGELR